VGSVGWSVVVAGASAGGMPGVQWRGIFGLWAGVRRRLFGVWWAGKIIGVVIMKDFSWILKRDFQEKVEDLGAFIKASLVKDGLSDLVEGRLKEAIDNDVSKFLEGMKEGDEIWFWDNKQTLTHANGFAKVRDGAIIDFMPFWTS
jgi:hypothetical protein